MVPESARVPAPSTMRPLAPEMTLETVVVRPEPTVKLGVASLKLSVPPDKVTVPS